MICDRCKTNRTDLATSGGEDLCVVCLAEEVARLRAERNNLHHTIIDLLPLPAALEALANEIMTKTICKHLNAEAADAAGGDDE